MALPQPTNTKQADLSAQIDGLRTVFTLPEQYIAGSVAVFLSGVAQQPITSIWFEGPGVTEITFVDPPDNVEDYTLTVQYEVDATSFPIVIASGIPPF